MLPFAMIVHFNHSEFGCEVVVEFIVGTDSIVWYPVP